MVSDEALAAQRSLILYIDIYRIEQVIRNLITNAVREIYLYFLLQSSNHIFFISSYLQMKFTPRDGKVTVGISCVLFKSGRLPSLGDKVRLQLLNVCAFLCSQLINVLFL